MCIKITCSPATCLLFCPMYPHEDALHLLSSHHYQNDIFQREFGSLIWVLSQSHYASRHQAEIVTFCKDPIYIEIWYDSASITCFLRYICCSPKILDHWNMSWTCQMAFGTKWFKSTDYLIYNIFINCFLSLIACELAWHIYLDFIQLRAELVELLTILWKHPIQGIFDYAFSSNIICNKPTSRATPSSTMWSYEWFNSQHQMILNLTRRFVWGHFQNLNWIAQKLTYCGSTISVLKINSVQGRVPSGWACLLIWGTKAFSRTRWYDHEIASLWGCISSLTVPWDCWHLQWMHSRRQWKTAMLWNYQTTIGI